MTSFARPAYIPQTAMQAGPVTHVPNAALAAHGLESPAPMHDAGNIPPLKVAAAVNSVRHLSGVAQAAPLHFFAIEQSTMALHSIAKSASLLFKHVFTASRQPPIAVGVQAHAWHCMLGCI
jgi:hypothetical protein